QSRSRVPRRDLDYLFRRRTSGGGNFDHGSSLAQDGGRDARFLSDHDGTRRRRTSPRRDSRHRRRIDGASSSASPGRSKDGSSGQFTSASRSYIMKIRKIVTHVEDVLAEGGRPVEPAARVAVVAAVIENPWAGEGFVDDLNPGIDKTASPSGELLAPRVVEERGAGVEAYGQAAIVGCTGAVEKRGPAGIVFDVCSTHKTDATVRSHHQTAEMRVAAAPHAEEIVAALAASAQGRQQQRLAELSTVQYRSAMSEHTTTVESLE